MALTPRFLSDTFRDMQNAMNTFDEAFNRPFLTQSLSASRHYPATNIEERPDAYQLSAELPGYDKKDIKIEWTGDRTLVLSGTVNKDSESKNDETSKKYWHKERFCSSFSRSFSFPASVDSEKISAKFENGVLEVTIPKSSISQPRQIKL